MKYIIKPCSGLAGSIRISGAKNSALPILAATLLTSGSNRLFEIPDLGDIWQMLNILSHLGCTVGKHGNSVIANCDAVNKYDAPYEMTGRLRASFLVMGPLLARWGHAKISLPGGCPIGSRPVDLHLKGLSALGATISKGNGYVEVHARELTGTKIYLDFPSVGATENILMAATLAKGQTIIENAASEPEIVDLATYLNSCGAQITGAGTDNIKIAGVKSLAAGSHTIIPDRIEAGTFMTAAAITHSNITIENIMCNHVKPLMAKLREIGVLIEENADSITINASGRLCSTDIKTLPFPGYPTDMQALTCALLSVVPGTSIIIETVFENRFMHIAELCRMGADIKIEGHTAVVEGKEKLMGAKVAATDLRAGAALVIAALCADGDSEVDNIEHIQRGYENFDSKLRSLGAQITLGR